MKFYWIALILFACLCIALGPLATIWSLNTLFDLAIPYVFKSWLAVVWLCLLFNSNRATGKKD
jgi:hypothetical protein